MADESLPDHETIERVLVTEPNRLLDRLQDGYRKERAREHLKIAHGYVKEMREQQKADR
jgi:hypothetical protein